MSVDCNGLGPDDLEVLKERFHAAHAKEYGYNIRDRSIEFVSIRLKALGQVARVAPPEVAGGPSLQAAGRGTRKVYFDAALGWLETAHYERAALPADALITGPAIITEMSATTLVLPGQNARTDRPGNLILRETP